MTAERGRGAAVPLVTAATGLLVLSVTLFGARATAVAPGATDVHAAGAAGTGSLSLVLRDGAAGFAQSVSGLAPGDVLVQDLALVSGGTLRGAHLVAGVVPDRSGPLVSDTAGSRALRVSISACDIEGHAAAACPVPLRPLVTSVPLDRVVETELAVDALRPGRVLALRVALTLPDQDETVANGVRPVGSVQGRAVRLAWSFTTRQAEAP